MRSSFEWYRHRDASPDTKEVNVNLTAERPFEQFAEFEAFRVFTFVHVIRERDLLEVVKR